jgi:hypothetical protein
MDDGDKNGNPDYDQHVIHSSKSKQDNWASSLANF